MKNTKTGMPELDDPSLHWMVWRDTAGYIHVTIMRSDHTATPWCTTLRPSAIKSKDDIRDAARRVARARRNRLREIDGHKDDFDITPYLGIYPPKTLN